ncbi:tRNA (guanosine(46)-N7)-methyltransferase TrmB [Helicobacter sp. 13S00477-4]|uniref:tRNA (guanosine(46)-N7)-methyltransferase TrmB n=1 Tax=Helicobacter sp. 13S00477-4 TaxID=1905759 RepID=UPI000BA66366|nr:tRNA (guanosine(46)-N7)-methyltransferase TrmB [Helicobacter sp. 13S00477-4]PAF51017.1 tRNA (guanosine(46)-N7)-methyltransferase TrmB [Helicobacter sp. 13S00477-4]
MPHFLAKDLFLQTPFSEDGYEFLYQARSLRKPNESLICISYGKHIFFLREVERKKDILIKAEKNTKPNPTGILKGALRVLAKRACVISHNLNEDSSKQTNQSDFLLKPSQIMSMELNDFCIEIGFGSGRHLLKMAQENPDQKYIGVEIHTPSIEQILRQVQLLDLKNIFVVCMDARILLEILPSNRCQAIYIHFPIPWNKKPHRRVIVPALMNEAMRVLKKDSMLHFRTDDEVYFKDVFESILSEKNVRIEVAKNLSNTIVSKYEARWQRQQKNIFDLKVFCLKEDKEQKIEYDFNFDFFDIKESICESQKIVRQDYFLHICDVFKTQDKVILSVSFGNFNQPVNKMVIFDKKNQEAFYFGEKPLATCANVMAHQELLKLLAEDK